MDLFDSLDPSWKARLQQELALPYILELEQKVAGAYASTTCFPAQKDLFNAFSASTFEKTKVVIIGQDPYHGPEQAHGFAFSVPDHVAVPPSLKNIYRELNADLDKLIPPSGDLTHWAEQGTLLINATLTVEKGKAGAHQKFGWERFTDAVIRTISAEKEFVVFLLWGAFAQKKSTLIDTQKHMILTSGHPSPLSANRGYWFGNRHFSKTNKFLRDHDLTPIDW